MLPLLLVSRTVPARAQTPEDLLRLLRSPGSVGLLRHARAPGTGDPPGFRLGDCATQRNLDAAGREQARGIGARAILVTHQVNVTTLTGVYPGNGEMVVMRPGPDGHVVAGRLTLARA